VRPVDTFTRGALRFEVSDAGRRDGEPVVLLHGFPADRHCWDGATARLVDAGYRTLAPDQRGYTAGAAPPGRRDYRVDLLAGDVVALADAAAVDRFHLVGHDWGAAVAWYLAGAHPERVATLTALSVPHPAAMRATLVSGGQALRSWYMLAFQVPGTEQVLAARRGELLRRVLGASGLGPEAAARYAARARTPDGLRGPLAWYRALPWSGRTPTHRSPVPTALVWGQRDRFITGAAARACGRFVTGPYELVEAPASHWLPEEEPELVARTVLGLAGRHPVGAGPAGR